MGDIDSLADEVRAEQGRKLLKFGHCPGCGSTDTVVRRLVQQAREKGLARDDWEPCMGVVQGIVAQPDKARLVGQAMPAYQVKTDVCCQCGTMYAVEIQLTTAQQTVQAAAPKPFQVMAGGNGRK